MSSRTMLGHEMHFDLLYRRERSLFIRACLARVARRLAQRIEAAAHRRAAKVLRQETTRRLRMLDDRMLADIGLTRGEIAFTSRGDELRSLHIPG
jgi:uncharacterized protein YjiS (DUF1127 family)